MSVEVHVLRGTEESFNHGYNKLVEYSKAYTYM